MYRSINNKLITPLLKGKIKLKTMGSYIDFQIKVTGSINSLQKLKDLLIKVDHENKTYDIDYKILMQQKIGMLSRKCIEHDEFDHSALNEFHILEDFVNNFKFEYYENSTFYDWFGCCRDADLGIWDSNCWQNFSTYCNELIFNGVANRTPPIIHVISASRLFPDLFFRISFFNATDEMHPMGSIEGQNGQFAESKLNFFYIDSISKKRVYSDGFGNWFYYEDHECLGEDEFIIRVVDELFESKARYNSNNRNQLYPFQPEFKIN